MPIEIFLFRDCGAKNLYQQFSVNDRIAIKVVVVFFAQKNRQSKVENSFRVLRSQTMFINKLINGVASFLLATYLKLEPWLCLYPAVA